VPWLNIIAEYKLLIYLQKKKMHFNGSVYGVKFLDQFYIGVILHSVILQK